MKLPNFLVVGAPKAGTTSMHRYLREHPQIYVTGHKGLHYFTYPDLAANVAGPGDPKAIEGFCQTLEEYASHYTQVTNQKTIGDNSPSYLYYAHCIPKIKATLGPEVKIIIMVRNPIDRAFSNYQHLVRSGRETLSFFDALNEEESRIRNHWGDFWRYKDHSLYFSKVTAYIEAFSREQVHIVLHDQLAVDPRSVAQHVYRFLEVDGEIEPANINIVYNKGGIITNPLIKLLDNPANWKAKVKQLLPRTLYRQLRNAKESLVERSKVDDSKPDKRSVTLLQEYFHRDIIQMAQLLETDLTSWDLPTKGVAHE